MIEVVDRKPLGNKKNNILALTIPPEITTLPQLIALLSSGCYGDIKANNASSGPDVGAAVIGTPINKAIFESIDEGGGGSLGDLEDIAICSSLVTLTAGWTWVPFVRNFIAIPEVVATIADEAQLNTAAVSIKGITDAGFYAAVRRVDNNAFVACTLSYIACCDTGIGK